MKDSLLMKVLGGVFVVILSVFVIAKTRNALAERDYIGKQIRDRDTMTISGEGKMVVKPDLAKVDIGLLSEGTVVRDVQQANTQKMNAVIASLKGLGIEEKDIQTSNYNLQPKIDWRDGRQNITGYTLSQTVTAKIRNLEKVGDVVQKATESGANQVYGVQFTIDDPTSVRDEARIKAIKDAQRKAEQLADALGLHVVKAVSFSESTGGYVPPMPYAMKAADAGREVAAAPDIQPGQLDVDMNVSVVFEVR